MISRLTNHLDMNFRIIALTLFFLRFQINFWRCRLNEFDVKVLREELDLLTRFHYENKSNFECLVEDNVPDVNLDGSRSTCEGSLIHYDEHKRVSPLSFGRGKKRFDDVYVDEGFIGKKIAETLGTAHRHEYALSNSSRTYPSNKPFSTKWEHHTLNGVELEDSYEDLESSDSDDEDNGTTLQELVGKGRENISSGAPLSSYAAIITFKNTVN